MNEAKVLYGDCLEQLKTLPDKSIDCCVTSPPYYGLRDYGTGRWEGGDTSCPHYRISKFSENDCTGHRAMGEQGEAVGDAIYKSVCPLCGAVRVDKQIGLEETPEEYIEKMVSVFREVRRVLKDNGTCWINIGDTYQGSGSAGCDFTGKYSDASAIQKGNHGTDNLSNVSKRNKKQGDIKPKDMIGIPWMLAFALRNDGWYLRQDIIWSKSNPLPESVTDRCTKSHEYIFLLTKSPKYYFDSDAIKEPAVTNENRPYGVVRNRELEYNSKFNNHPEAFLQSVAKETEPDQRYMGKKYTETPHIFYRTKSSHAYDIRQTRNKRDVWNVATKPYKGSHFATYPKELITPCILAGCPKNGTVLDPFLGSGTTAQVSIENGRNCVGIELNKDYSDLINQRINEAMEIQKYKPRINFCVAEDESDN